MIDVAAKLLLGYLLGTVVGSLVLGRFWGGVDIRTQGSGNAGGSNALRTRGPWFALCVVIIDVGKGWLAARWVPQLSWGVGAPLRGDDLAEWLAPGCALAAIAGHMRPVWFGWRGGKGVATFLGALSALNLPLLGVFLIAWMAAMILSGYVGLASVLAASAVTVGVVRPGNGAQWPMQAFVCLAALMIVFAHRGNLRRIRSGSEPRVRRIWLLGRMRK